MVRLYKTGSSPVLDQQHHPQIFLLQRCFCQLMPWKQRWFKMELCKWLMLILVWRGWEVWQREAGTNTLLVCWSCIVSCSIPPFESHIVEKLINTLIPVPRNLMVCQRTSHRAAVSRKRTKSGISALTKQVLLKIKVYSFPETRLKLSLNWSRTENRFRKQVSNERERLSRVQSFVKKMTAKIQTLI